MSNDARPILTDNREAHAAGRLIAALELLTQPVGVWLIGRADDLAPFARLDADSLRFCQALMRARRGGAVLLTPAHLACPAAARAFGFRPLPPALESGDALVGFDIVSAAATGRTMFEQMPRLPMGAFVAVAAAPLGTKTARPPDVIVVEGPAEALMWLALADLNRAGGVRRHGDTAVLQATCVDAAVVPCQEQRLNFSLGCYGCREATDLEPAETVLGFPAAHLDGVVEALDRLRATAIPRSRAKKSYELLQRTHLASGDRTP